MSGLAGVLSEVPGAGHAWLARAGQLLRHSPAAGTAQWPGQALQLLYASVRPTSDRLDVGRREGRTLFVVGETYNVAELAGRYLGERAVNGAAQARAETLLALYQARGLQPFTELNGAFTLGVWEEPTSTLHLVTDRMGLRKLYYTAVPGALLFASEVKALLASPHVRQAVDLRGLGHLLSVGYLLDDRTLYEAIRLVRGGHVLTYALGQQRLIVTPYWEPRYATSGNTLTLEECAGELYRRLERAVARQIEGVARIGIPLSGGLDSRALLGCSRRLRPHGILSTFTVGHRHTYDVIFARRMARVCGTHHHYLPLGPTFLAQHASRFTWLTDGLVSAHNGWYMGAGPLLGRTCDRALTGFLGDVLNTYPGWFRSRLLEATDLDGLAQTVLRIHGKFFSREALHALVRPRYFDVLSSAAAADYERCVRDTSADALADRAMLANLLQRQQRCVWYPFATLGASLPVGAPFADNEVVEFLLTVPQRYRVREQAYVAMFCAHLPALARVAWEDSGLPLRAGRLRRFAHTQWKDFHRDLVPRWTQGRYQPHNRRPCVHHGAWMRSAPMRRYLQQAFARGEPYLAQWCEMAEVRRILARHFAGSIDASFQISALLTLALWFGQAEPLRPLEAPEDRVAGSAVPPGRVEAMR